ncbi:MAG: hypothetical protein Q4F41_04540 [Eubacteriales bacterium]|nr:hypothetical protein [Eubacteriales bacterium]
MSKGTCLFFEFCADSSTCFTRPEAERGPKQPCRHGAWTVWDAGGTRLK